MKSDQKIDMAKIITAWLIWYLINGAYFVIDYFLRIQNTDIKSGGLSEAMQISVHIFALSIFVTLVFKAQRHLVLWQNIALIFIQALIVFSTIIYFSIYYVCTFGIDCF